MKLIDTTIVHCGLEFAEYPNKQIMHMWMNQKRFITVRVPDSFVQQSRRNNAATIAATILLELGYMSEIKLSKINS